MIPVVVLASLAHSSAGEMARSQMPASSSRHHCTRACLLWLGTTFLTAKRASGGVARSWTPSFWTLGRCRLERSRRLLLVVLPDSQPQLVLGKGVATRHACHEGHRVHGGVHPLRTVHAMHNWGGGVGTPGCT